MTREEEIPEEWRATRQTTGAVSADELRVFCLDALTRVGVGEEDAQTTADVLVTTDTWGVFTHGVKSLPAYIRRIRAGGIRANARPRVTAEGSGWAIVDGDSGSGHGRLNVCNAGRDRESACVRDRLCGRVQ